MSSAGTLPSFVIVSFENNDELRPIILGYLYHEVTNDTAISINLQSLNVSGSTKLGYDTCIGDINYSDMEKLKGCHTNLQKQLEAILDRINTLEAITENIKSAN